MRAEQHALEEQFLGHLISALPRDETHVECVLLACMKPPFCISANIAKSCVVCTSRHPAIASIRFQPQCAVSRSSAS